jgi:hypothetical protein
MSKETKTIVPATAEQEESSATFSEPKLSLKDLSALAAALGEAMKTASAEQAAVLANAFAESRRPYQDPAQAENARKMREQMRDQAKQIRLSEIAAKNACPHVQGANAMSSSAGTKSSFCLLKLPTGEVVGVCSNCQKVISNRIPRHLALFKGANTTDMAQSGHREFFGPAHEKASTYSVVSREEQ